MSRSATAQKTGAFQLPLISASQIGQTQCMARWGYSRLEGLKEPSGKNAIRGTNHHEEMENWCRYGILPHSKPALAALKFAPAPGVAEVEVPIRFDTAGSPWLGFIDVAYDWNGTQPVSICSTGWTVIHDWKFTGNLRNAKDADTLLEDPAANIYAWEAFLGGATKVSGRWIYIQMDGAAHTREVWFHFDYDTVKAHIEHLDTKAADLQTTYAAYKAGNLTVADLPKNTAHCYSFGQKCPRMDDRCQPQQTFNLTADNQNTGETMDFKEMIANSFPGGPAPKAVPSIPPKLTVVAKAPPLPPKRPIDVRWEQLTKYLTEPEAGFVNSPEAPKVAAASPEHAAELQGITAPVAVEVEATDELDTYNRDQLKAIAVQLGAVPESSRAREPALKEAIRRVRAQGPAEVVAVEEPVFPRAVVPPAPVAVPEKAIAPDHAVVPFVAPPQADRTEFILYVNCSPALHTGLYMTDVMKEANARVKEQLKVDDYRLVPFGGGPGALCVAVKQAFEDGVFDRFDSLVIDARTPEGNVLLETLSSYADEVIRGF